MVTQAPLRSREVEKEVLQAQRQTKKIIPFFHSDVKDNQIKWELDKIQGFRFHDKFELARGANKLIDLLKHNVNSKLEFRNMEDIMDTLNLPFRRLRDSS